MNPIALEMALSILLNRHSVLQCRLEDRDGAPWLIPPPKAQAPLFTLIDHPANGEVGAGGAIEKDIAEVVWRPFDVSTEPLYRAYAVRLGHAEAYIGLVVHHIIADSVAIGILLGELRYIYETLIRGGSPKLPTPGLSYQSYLQAMTTWIESGPGVEALDEVVDKLRVFPQFDLAPRIVEGVDEEDFFLDSHVCAKVRSAAKRLGVSPFTILLAVQNLLLLPYCSSATTPMKVITAGREFSLLTRIVGNMADRMFVLSDLGGCSSFADVVRQTQAALSWCRRYALVRYEFIQAAPMAAGITMAAPVFNFRTVQRSGGMAAPATADPDGRALRVPPIQAEKTRPHDAYYLVMTDDGEQMRGNIRYGRGHLAGFVDQFGKTLSDVCDDPAAALSPD